ncbi:hypothetical protein KOW79_006779 [Hemibagrus wyckioides]|uniref:Uncharacterized protein n=1 Tax=Hemibagrus wyckioides TaxID=337641 RepID=A0A9D3P124_9TELE|nr:hypothetical protein KOW79_006779 [Hemibagrus wyckioides]
MAASTAERAPVRRARAKSDPPHLAEPAITFSFKTASEALVGAGVVMGAPAVCCVSVRMVMYDRHDAGAVWMINTPSASSCVS